VIAFSQSAASSLLPPGEGGRRPDEGLLFDSTPNSPHPPLRGTFSLWRRQQTTPSSARLESLSGKNMKVPRFTIRSLLILVALVAMTIEGQMLWSRSKQYRAKAVFHAMEERKFRLSAKEWLEGADRNVTAVAKAVKLVEDVKAKIKENELYAQANADSKIESEFANNRQVGYRLLLESREIMLKSRRYDEAESAVRYRSYAADESRLAAYHAALSREYHRAEYRPWFGVAADPPIPSKTP
jgi:hypothetical protein